MKEATTPASCNTQKSSLIDPAGLITDQSGNLQDNIGTGIEATLD